MREGGRDEEMGGDEEGMRRWERMEEDEEGMRRGERMRRG